MTAKRETFWSKLAPGDLIKLIPYALAGLLALGGVLGIGSGAKAVQAMHDDMATRVSTMEVAMQGVPLLTLRIETLERTLGARQKLIDRRYDQQNSLLREINESLIVLKERHR